MNEMLQNTFRKSKYSRIIDPHTRVSTAQRTVASTAPVSVSFTQPKMDPDEIRRVSARVLNMQHLIAQIFDGSLAGMAVHTEMAPDRLRALMEMHIPFSSEIAEHLEKCMNLPGGWLDNKRSSIDADHLKTIVFGDGAGLGVHHAAELDRLDNTEPGNAHHVAKDEKVKDGISDAKGCHHACAPAHQPEHQPEQPLGTDVVDVVRHSMVALEDAHPEQNQAGSLANDSPPSHQDGCDMKAHTEIPMKEVAPMKEVDSELTPEPLSQSVDDGDKAEPKRLDDPVTQTLIWLNHELGRYRGTAGGPIRQEIAAIMDRAPSTLSTWLTGVRKMPSEMLVPLVLAIHKTRLPLASEFQDRMRVAAPAAMRYMPEVANASNTNEAKDARDTKECAPNMASALTSVPASAIAPVKLPAESMAATDTDRVSYGSQPVTQADKAPADSVEFKLTIAKAADRVASVLQRLLER